ncbi:MAG: PSD1 and planctomycete cytochrome C domain-containing protein [Pirellulales bacterium]
MHLQTAMVCAAALLAAGSASRADGPPIVFNRDIRPLLSDRCFACHGPDNEDRQAGLRLDSRDAAIATLDSGARAVVPGDPAASEIIRRITSSDPDVVMPPPRVGKPITPAEADLLARWIRAGAEYRGHFAFERVERPAEPAVKAVGWPRTPIDRFILARLEQENLAPNPEADRITLARRLALDLTGLPPTPQEIDAFVNDPAPEAYERYVDRLLASPHYGERMAIEWLDAARYADSHGYQADGSRDHWPWRDWVIKAFNDNLPFDQFTIEQLAGDLLDAPTREQLLATGFNRNVRLNGEGGTIDEEWRVETICDRVETTGQAWLGLSLNCARCHDHKYDPISQRDYYALFALFGNVPEPGTLPMALHVSGGNAEPTVRLSTPEQEQEIARLEKAKAEADTAARAEAGRLATLLAEWEPAFAAALAAAKPDDKGVVKVGDVAVPEPVRAALGIAREQRSPQQQDVVAKFFREQIDSPLRRGNLARDAAAKAVVDYLRKVPSAMIMKEGPPRDAFVLARGEYDKRGDKVEPALPAFLSSIAPAPSAGRRTDRLALARWLVSRDNPLPSRVWVNRMWERFFGTGLVKTSENLGSQAEYPSHPELLDWLAAELMEAGSLPAVNGVAARPWDMKAFVKLLVTSAVYRQAATMTPEKLARDPENRLLARGSRFRLPAEVVRDEALFVAGLLVPTVGGPSVRPFMPAGVWDETGFFGNLKNYRPDTDSGRHRRSVYTIWKRTAAPPTMLLFDAPARETCALKRSRTNTPLQALALLNETTFVEAAHGLAGRMLDAADATPSGRIAHGFRLALGRPPQPIELSALVRGYDTNLAAYRADVAAAEKFAGVGVVKRPKNVPAAEFAALSLAANVILNLDEFVMRE